MSDLSYLILAMYAFCGRSQVIHALSLSWLFTMCNTAFVPEGSGGGVWRYMVIVAGFISVFSRSREIKWTGRINKYLAMTLALAAFISAHSLLVSPVVDVSLLKLISWLMVFATLQGAWGEMPESEQIKTFGQLKFGLATILLLSVPLLAIPEIGFRVNGEGFQGILNHPQTLGPIAAIACVITALQIFSTTKSQWSSVFMFLVAIVLVFLSEARTAGAALILAVDSNLKRNTQRFNQ